MNEKKTASSNKLVLEKEVVRELHVRSDVRTGFRAPGTGTRVCRFTATCTTVKDV